MAKTRSYSRLKVRLGVKHFNFGHFFEFRNSCFGFIILQTSLVEPISSKMFQEARIIKMD